MSLSLTYWRVAAVVALAIQVMAQQCYYPNGDKAPATDKACSSAKGSACCPDKWECLDNGLCHYPPDNLYGRYSCTDKDWKSEGCPSSLCTYGLEAAGAETVSQCSNHGNQWCCDADGTHVDCCKESPSPRPFFALQDPAAYATIGFMTASTAPNLASITGEATGSGSGDQASASPTPPPKSSSASSLSNSPSALVSSKPASTVESTSTPKLVTSVLLSASSDSTGIVSVPITSVTTPTADVNVQSDDGSKDGGSDSNLGLIIGCAVGIPLGLALIGLVVWLLRRRRQQKDHGYHKTAEAQGDKWNAASSPGGKLSKEKTFRSSGRYAAEIDGNPVGAGQSISTVVGHAELESGNGFQPGCSTPYTPDAVGIGGSNARLDRNTWDSVPPRYSAEQKQKPYRYPEVSELADTSVAPATGDKGEQQ